MYIAMNRFKIKPGDEAAFEQIWRERDTFLDSVPGFISFNLLKGPTSDQHSLFASHSVWQDQTAFEAWTKSDAFRKAHANVGNSRKDIYLGPPQFEGFESVL
ncbi:MAG: antibiotic biosynthesis monooxygenase [Motiliproteus sp.]